MSYEYEYANEDENEDIRDRLQRYICYRYDDTYILEYTQKKPTSVRKLSRNLDYPLHIACHSNQPDNLVMKLIEFFFRWKHINNSATQENIHYTEHVIAINLKMLS